MVYERLTDRAREALACGRLAAQQCGHRTIEPAHLLVGTLRNRDTLGCQALDETGLRYIDVLTRVEEMYERAEHPPHAPPLLSVDAKRLLEDALVEAVAAGQRFAGTAHLALAFSRADAGSPLGTVVAGREQAIRVAVQIAVRRSAQLESELRAGRRQAPPYRSPAARAEALQRANLTRTRRAQLKRDLKSGRESIHDVLLTPPGYLQAAKVFDILLAVPSYGRTRVSSVLTRCRISPSKTIGGLSERQRAALLEVLR